MNFPELDKTFQLLAENYQTHCFARWRTLYEEDESYTEDNFEENNSDEKWQARIEVLYLENDTKGNYAAVSGIVYPEGVNSLPPAPYFSMLVYESGRVTVKLPSHTYTYVQKLTNN